MVSKRTEVINHEASLKTATLSGSVDLSCAGQPVAISTDQVLDISGRCNHVVRIALDPVLSVQPRKHLLEELIRVALGNTKLSDPDWLVEGGVEVLKVFLEVLSLVPGVVVSDDEIDLAVAAAVHELLEPVDALVGFVAVGNSWGADAETLSCKRLDVLAVGGDCGVDLDVGTSATD